MVRGEVPLHRRSRNSGEAPGGASYAGGRAPRRHRRRGLHRHGACPRGATRGGAARRRGRRRRSSTRRCSARRLGADRAFASGRRSSSHPTWMSCTCARRTTFTSRSPRRRWRPASTSSARSRSRSTSPGAQRLTELAARFGPCALVPFVYRYHPTVREARERVRSGQTGAVRLVHGSTCRTGWLRPEDDNWRVDARPRRRVARVRRHRVALVRPRRVRHRAPHRAPERADADRVDRARRPPGGVRGADATARP